MQSASDKPRVNGREWSRRQKQCTKGVHLIVMGKVFHNLSPGMQNALFVEAREASCGTLNNDSSGACKNQAGLWPFHSKMPVFAAGASSVLLPFCPRPWEGAVLTLNWGCSNSSTGVHLVNSYILLTSAQHIVFPTSMVMCSIYRSSSSAGIASQKDLRERPQPDTLKRHHQSDPV